MIRPAFFRLLLPLIVAGLSPLLRAADAKDDTMQRAQALATKGDMKGAVELLKTAAEKGNAEAANAIGEVYLAGQGVTASASEAARWFQQAADASNPLAMVNLGILLSKGGDGVPADPDKAQFLIRSAAEEGFAPAQAIMGKQAEKDGKDDGDPVEARAWYEKAAVQENADGLLAMARFYDEGIGGPRDPVKGFESCRRAALAGSPLAMNEIGVRYQKGLGVPADPTNAIGWFTVAGQRGLAAAQVNLGNCFEVGNGVLQDLALARMHYATAARQQFGPAQFLLAQIFERGAGTAANPVYAYANYSLAAARGLEAAKKKVDELKSKLTADQLRDAEKIVADGGRLPDGEAKPGGAKK